MSFFAHGGDEAAGDPEETRKFVRVAEGIVESWLAGHPEYADRLGVHDPDGAEETSGRLGGSLEGEPTIQAEVVLDSLGALDQLDETALSDDDAVDLEVLRGRMAFSLWQANELRPEEWNPLEDSVAATLHDLITRPGSDLATRLRGMTTRLYRLSDVLEAARETLADMPAVHVVAAVEEFRAARQLLGEPLGDLIRAEADGVVPGDSRPFSGVEAGLLASAREAADEALGTHVAWLESRLPESHGDPTLGPERYAAMLWYLLDTQLDSEALLTRAQSDLIGYQERLGELAGEAGFAAPEDFLAALTAPVRESEALDVLRVALRDAERSTRELGLVEVPGDPGDVLWTPPAYSWEPARIDVPGVLEGDVDALTAVSYLLLDEPGDAGFHRGALSSLAAREGVPGRMLQHSYARRYAGRTRIRAVFPSASFAAGWALYAEEALAAAKRRGEEPLAGDAEAWALLARLRGVTEAVVDVRVHAHGMTEAEALALLRANGYLDEAAARRRWRETLLHPTRLAAGYVGYLELTELLSGLVSAQRAADPAGSRGGAAALHGEVLAHGTLAPRHLVTLKL